MNKSQIAYRQDLWKQFQAFIKMESKKLPKAHIREDFVSDLQLWLLMYEHCIALHDAGKEAELNTFIKSNNGTTTMCAYIWAQ